MTETLKLGSADTLAKKHTGRDSFIGQLETLGLSNNAHLADQSHKFLGC